MNRRVAWVADVGGTNVRLAVVAADGSVLAETGLATADFPAPPATWPAMVEYWRRLDGSGAPVGTAIGLPARLGDDGLILFAPNVPDWTGANPVVALEAALDRPAYVVQDAQAGLLGERWLGQAPACFYFLAIGTGIGGAYQIDGHPARGAHNLAGVPATVRTAQMGHVEDTASGRAVAAAVGVDSGRTALTLARQGDPAAAAVFARAAEALQDALGAITGLLDVSEVRIGGGFGLAAFDLLFPSPELVPRVRTYPPIHDDVAIHPATTGSRAQILGLAAAVFAA